MPSSTPRLTVLQRRAADLAAAVRRFQSAQPGAAIALKASVSRLRDLLPVLQIESGHVTKLDERLRKMARRLVKLRTHEAHLLLADAAWHANPELRPATARIRSELRRRRSKVRLEPLRKKIADDARRVRRRVAAAQKALESAGETRTGTKDLRWALRALAVRRGAGLRDATERAGTVYLMGRLHDVRRTVKKLRSTLSLMSDLAGNAGGGHERVLRRAHDALDEIRDLESLVRRVRQLQNAAAPPDPKAWQQFDVCIRALDHRVRRAHARYLRTRPALQALGSKLATRPAGRVQRKAG